MYIHCTYIHTHAPFNTQSNIQLSLLLKDCYNTIIYSFPGLTLEDLGTRLVMIMNKYR